MHSKSNTAFNLRIILVALFAWLLPMPGNAQTGNTSELKFTLRHRVNAHGDEFNSLAKSLDGQRLFVGTEKGEIIIWNIGLRRVERKLQQPSPVHFVTTLSDPNYIIASGANHHEPVRPLVRKWNLQPVREFTTKALITQSAVSANGQWLAVLDSSQTLCDFEIATGKQTAVKATDEWGAIVVTNDGRYVYRVASEGKLTRWNMQTGEVSDSVLATLRNMHTRADFITLANDDKWLITAGNHGDVGIFDPATVNLVSYTRTTAAGFYVEKVWVSGDRMIFTTDTGVMFAGLLTK